MSTQQPEALRLADAMDAVNKNNADSLLVQMAARSASAELRRLHALNAELLADMKAARQSMQVANDTPNGPISDTIWHGPAETLFDFMDYAIAKAEGREA